MLSFFFNKYNNSHKKNNKFISLKITELQIKKALNLILSYHIKHKQILFVGFPKILNKTIQIRMKNLKHSFLPANFWFPGSFTNNNRSFRFKIQNPSLIVVFNKNKTDNLLLLNEIQTINIPVIIFGPVSNKFLLSANLYVVNRIFAQRSLNHFLFYLIYSILKKNN